MAKGSSKNPLEKAKDLDPCGARDTRQTSSDKPERPAPDVKR